MLDCFHYRGRLDFCVNRALHWRHAAIYSTQYQVDSLTFRVSLKPMGGDDCPQRLSLFISNNADCRYDC